MDLPFRVDWLIYEGKSWNVILHDNQSYFGRCIVYLTRPLEDPLHVRPDENQELWYYILPRLAKALRQKPFEADRINYAHLANMEHFVHWHVVPRYEKEPYRFFANTGFGDHRVGKHYAPEPERRFSGQVMSQIQQALRSKF